MDNNKKYDVFISHASEDKDETVRPKVTKISEIKRATTKQSKLTKTSPLP